MKFLKLILIALLVTSCGKFSKDENVFESEKLIPTCMKGIQASKVFHASKLVNTKEEAPPKSRFRK